MPALSSTEPLRRDLSKLKVGNPLTLVNLVRVRSWVTQRALAQLRGGRCALVFDVQPSAPPCLQSDGLDTVTSRRLGFMRAECLAALAEADIALDTPNVRTHAEPPVAM